jgi:hypothetical protein
MVAYADAKALTPCYLTFSHTSVTTLILPSRENGAAGDVYTKPALEKSTAIND